MNEFKHVLVFLIFLFVTPIMAYTKPTPKYLHVNGKISNFRYNPDTAVYISTSTLNQATNTPKTSLVLIRSDGSFAFTLPLLQSQEVSFQYLQTRFFAFAHPGGILNISFDSKMPAESLKYSGDEARLNNEMHLYNIEFRRFNERHFASFNNKFKIAKDSPDLYKQLVYETASLNRSFLDSFSRANNTGALFKSHANIARIYSTAYDLISFGLNNSKTSEHYYSFLKDFPLENAAAAYSEVYLMFLESYGLYLMKDDTDVDKYVSRLQKETKGFVLDLLLSWNIWGFLEADLIEGAEQYLPAYKKTVKNTTIKNEILSLYEEKRQENSEGSVSKESHLNKLPADAGQQLLNTIVDQYKGSVVYIDFWGTWCIPCIEEMPASRKLRDELKDKKVVFLYLAVQSQEANWKRSITKLNIEGEHYLLKDNEYQMLNIFFKMQGVPHYALIDKEGIVREKNTLRPGDPELRKKIENLLK